MNELDYIPGQQVFQEHFARTYLKHHRVIDVGADHPKLMANERPLKMETAWESCCSMWPKTTKKTRRSLLQCTATKGRNGGWSLWIGQKELSTRTSQLVPHASTLN